MISHAISASDALPLARLHERAFPGFFLSRLGVSFLVQFYLGFVEEPTAVVAVARDAGGHPQGVAVGTTDPVGFFGHLLRRRLVGFTLAALRAAVATPSAAPRLLAAISYRGDVPPGRGGALLSSICVDPSQTGRGVGSALLAAWSRRARSMGADLAFLTTDADGNDAVNDWYRREGWVLTDRYLARGTRAMNRYERDLQAVGTP